MKATTTEPTDQTDGRPFVPAPDLATRYGMPVSKIIKLAKKGELPALQIDGEWRFNIEDVDAWTDRPAVSKYRSASWIAAIYAVTPRTITGLAEKGEIPSIKVGGQWRFDADEVHACLTSHTTAPFAPRVRRVRSQPTSPSSVVATSNACPMQVTSK